jgi:hypothetical protein
MKKKKLQGRKHGEEPTISGNVEFVTGEARQPSDSSQFHNFKATTASIRWSALLQCPVDGGQRKHKKKKGSTYQLLVEKISKL